MNVFCLHITIIFCVGSQVRGNVDIRNNSVIFSVTSFGRLPSEPLLVTIRDNVGGCLHTCTQHLKCLTVNYERTSRKCELLADILLKVDVIDGDGWESYGHFTITLVGNYSYCAFSDATLSLHLRREWLSGYHLCF